MISRLVNDNSGADFPIPHLKSEEEVDDDDDDDDDDDNEAIMTMVYQ
jgi:hypothetical protein